MGGGRSSDEQRKEEWKREGRGKKAGEKRRSAGQRSRYIERTMPELPVSMFPAYS